MKRITALLLVLVFAVIGMTGCGKYTSHYNAIGHVRSNSSESASLSFMELDGTDVFKLKCKHMANDGSGAGIRYSGKLETGSLTVYYDCGGTKRELFSVQSGDDIASSVDTLTEKTVYIIVETDGKCKNGDFSFEIYYG